MWPGTMQMLSALAVTFLLLEPASTDFRTTHELIEQHGYPVEIHRVVTEDGYILHMHRIPHSGRQPVAPDDDYDLQPLEESFLQEMSQREAKRSSEYDAAPMKRLSIHEYLDPCRGEARRKSSTESWSSRMGQSEWSPEDSAMVKDDSGHVGKGRVQLEEGSAYRADVSGLEDTARLGTQGAWAEKQSAWTAKKRTNQARPVVLLQHGVLASSLDWVLTGPGKALGYKLSDAGYDVWLGNFRGTFYSRGHVNMTTDDAAYWNYSWDELGVFDLAAMVDHVLRATGHARLHFVGHSMGATVAVVLLSERPHYNHKLKVTVLLAPVVRLRHNTSVFRHYSAIWAALQRVSSYSGMRGFPPDPPMLHRRLAPVCRERYIGQGICANILHTVAGYASNINNTLLPMLFGHYPSQTSVRTLSHFLQGMNTGNFSKFDFGGGNMARYQQSHPPDYDINRITSVTAIFYGDSDPFTSTEDVAWLAGELPNLVRSYLVPSRAFSHLSFLWAADVDTVLYEPLLRLLDRQLRH